MIASKVVVLSSLVALAAGQASVILQDITYLSENVPLACETDCTAFQADINTCPADSTSTSFIPCVCAAGFLTDLTTCTTCMTTNAVTTAATYLAG
ncbi:hypothetical protein MNV49_007959 [Pseudohyphozyma bogoriensis]|nr:hypothetical protein MNV49_007959 [Pseudohyphozyma bogoriensis]